VQAQKKTTGKEDNEQEERYPSKPDKEAFQCVTQSEVGVTPSQW
jgi:hypothetical protein